jgi:hypothetical protein
MQPPIVLLLLGATLLTSNGCGGGPTADNSRDATTFQDGSTSGSQDGTAEESRVNEANGRRRQHTYMRIDQSTNDSNLDSVLSRCRNADSLRLSDTQVTDAGLVHLKQLPKLRRVILNEKQATDTGLKHLKEVTSLHELRLNNSLVTDAGLEHIKGMVNLRVLTLRDTLVTDAGLEHLKAMKELRLLDLTRTQVTDVGLEHLNGLTGLTRLRLQGTSVTDNGLKHLQGLTNLESLFLSLTCVSGAGLDHLDGLSNLKWLDLRFTQVTDADVTRLRTKLPKCRGGTASLSEPGGVMHFSALTGAADHRDGKWKLYASTRPTATIELYDWSEDPRELSNVADDHPEVVARLMGELRRWISRGSGSSRAKDEWLQQHGGH